MAALSIKDFPDNLYLIRGALTCYDYADFRCPQIFSEHFLHVVAKL